MLFNFRQCVKHTLLTLFLILPFMSFAYANDVTVISNTVTPEVRCMADVLYYEARQGNIKQNMLDVGNVVLNRVNDSRFPKTICSVVHQKTKNVCQFTWACNPHRITEPELYQDILVYSDELVALETSGLRVDSTHGSLFFEKLKNAHNKKILYKNSQHAFSRVYR